MPPMADARKRLIQARATLVLEQPFFGVLALRLAVVEDPSCDTAWTDGVRIGYNPKFVDTLTQPELVGLVAHEVMHVANGHVWRRDGREPVRWNYAADYAINTIIRDAKLTLPQGALLDQRFNGKSAEWIFARLPEMPPKGGKGAGQGAARPGAGGHDVRDAPSDAAEHGSTEADWQQAVQQAALAAKAVGKLPASLDRFAQQAAQPRVDWRSVLHRFVQQIAQDDYAWTRPNKRYVASGLYLPALRSETLGPIAIAIDTSGSIDQVTLDQFAAEVNAVISETRPVRTHVFYADAKVHRVDTFESGESIILSPVGGGGTAFAPALDAAEELDEPPVALIYLTDLYGSHRDEAPDFPVLWASTGAKEAPYGEVISLAEV